MRFLRQTWATILRLLRKLRPARRRNNSQEGSTRRASEYWDAPVPWCHKAEREEWRNDLSAYLTANGFNTSARRLSDNISVYSCTHINNLYTTHPIRIPRESVRRQVQNAPPRSSLEHYPKFHIGYEHWGGDYKLRARLPWVEFPILNNRTGRVWSRGGPPGPVRAVYNDADRRKFDIIYHDPLAGRHGVFKKATLRTSGSAARGEGSRAGAGMVRGHVTLAAH
ncbi:hypothetical protein C8A05DRAFT_36267 [Staphylotrichum tortipilum]|uniref:Uncharacterized protein n=1 Tax=Staphylotrichum tortipilum TaxID=2831512 RepID=A0AAN6MHM6_9PEZI|nr:hypothetical protein C8A05DRAFT_36267 [Staphylotrichum longicolle]